MVVCVMRLSHWLILIASVVGVGTLQVAQHQAIFMKGYAVGERMQRLHAAETEVLWLRTHVIGLTSPAHLSQVAQQRRLNLVAWSALPAAAMSAGVVSGASTPAVSAPSSSFAAKSSSDLARSVDHETSD